MEIAERKFNIIQNIIELDEIVLEKLELFLQSYHTDWLAELSSQDLIELEIGLGQAKSKELHTHKTVMNKFSKWHLK